MATLTTRYSVFDTVYYANMHTERKQHPCPDCKGERRWKAISPAGAEYAFACPRCDASYRSLDGTSLDYTAHVPSVQKLTIGSVRVDTHSGFGGKDEPVSYMCVETGVGGGSVYRESRLFPTEEEALQAAKLLADKANAETSWVVELYEKTLSISDYQLGSALIEEARKQRQDASALLYNLRSLFDDIEEADDKDEILEAVNNYRARKWESDKTTAAEQVPA